MSKPIPTDNITGVIDVQAPIPSTDDIFNDFDWWKFVNQPDSTPEERTALERYAQSLTNERNARRIMERSPSPKDTLELNKYSWVYTLPVAQYAGDRLLANTASLAIRAPSPWVWGMVGVAVSAVMLKRMYFGEQPEKIIEDISTIPQLETLTQTYVKQSFGTPIAIDEPYWKPSDRPQPIPVPAYTPDGISMRPVLTKNSYDFTIMTDLPAIKKYEHPMHIGRVTKYEHPMVQRPSWTTTTPNTPRRAWTTTTPNNPRRAWTTEYPITVARPNIVPAYPISPTASTSTTYVPSGLRDHVDAVVPPYTGNIITDWTGAIPQSTDWPRIPPYTIVQPQETSLDLRIVFARAHSQTNTAVWENTLRRDKKPIGAIAYLAALNLINKTWGRVSEVLDFYQVLASNATIRPKPGTNIVITVPSIDGKESYKITISKEQSLASLPQNAQKVLLRNMAMKGDLGYTFTINTAGLTMGLLKTQAQDIAIGTAMSIERDAINASGITDYAPFLDYGNISTWARRVKNNFYSN